MTVKNVEGQNCEGVKTRKDEMAKRQNGEFAHLAFSA